MNTFDYDSYDTESGNDTHPMCKVHMDTLFADMREGEVFRRNDMPVVKVDVGPFHCVNLPDAVRGNTVGRMEIPVILYDSRDRIVNGVRRFEEKYAVMVPPKKDFGIVCAGCYTPDISLWNDSRCVSCRTFANHLDTAGVDNARKRACLSDTKPYSLANAIDEAKKARGKQGARQTADTTTADLADISTENLTDLTNVSTDALTAALVARSADNDAKKALTQCLGVIDLKVLVDHVKAREQHVLPYFDFEFDQLEAEMRRLVASADTTKRQFYSKNKRKKGGPHYTNKPIVTWKYFSNKWYKSNSKGV